MRIHLHLLGGAGRIGTALVESLIANPLKDLSTIWIYCDATKTVNIRPNPSKQDSPTIRARSYSAFSLTPLLEKGMVKPEDKHSVINLRGVNNKLQWLNQPLDAIELQIQACRCIIDSDLWMYPGVEIIQMSSQLCDLIEGPLSLEEMCEGQESYRRPYMVSRLHQEAMLSANAFQHGIPTIFLRLPAVYGFADDDKSPWVLNSLCKQYRQDATVKPRNPERLVYLLHRVFLIEYLRMLLQTAHQGNNLSTVRYLRPPMLQMSVETLASLVRSSGHPDSTEALNAGTISLMSDPAMHVGDSSAHLEHLQSTIKHLLAHG